MNTCKQRTTLLLKTVRNFVVKTLEIVGFQVLTAEDGLEALEKAKAHKGKIDLLLSNLQMPRMNVIELAIQVSIERPDTKVLLMSGFQTGMLVPDKATSNHRLRTARIRNFRSS